MIKTEQKPNFSKRQKFLKMQRQTVNRIELLSIKSWKRKLLLLIVNTLCI